MPADDLVHSVGTASAALALAWGSSQYEDRLSRYRMKICCEDKTVKKPYYLYNEYSGKTTYLY